MSLKIAQICILYHVLTTYILPNMARADISACWPGRVKRKFRISTFVYKSFKERQTRQECPISKICLSCTFYVQEKAVENSVFVTLLHYYPDLTTWSKSELNVLLKIDPYTNLVYRNNNFLGWLLLSLFRKVMTGRCEASIDLICDWLLDKRRENLKLNMHFYLMIMIIIYYS